MTRRLIQAPLSETPAVDFRNTSVGTMQEGLVTSGTNRFFSWTPAGLQLGFDSALGAGNQGASARWFPPSPLDWSNTDTVYVECEWPVNVISPFLSIFIVADGGATYTNFINTTSLGAGVTKTQIRTVFPIRLSECSRAGSAVADFRTVTRNIQKIEFRFRASSDCPNPQSVRVTRIWTRPARSKCVITYDNLFASLYTLGWNPSALTGWRGAGLKGVMYVSAVNVGTPDLFFMRTSEVQAMYNDGWDVGLQNSSDTSTIYCNKALSGSLTSSGTTATWINAGNMPHLLVPGNTVVITGAQQPEYNGTFTVATTPNAHTFTYTTATTPSASPATGALVTCPRPGYSRAQIIADVGLSRAAVAAQGWTRGNEFFAYSQGVYDLDVIDAMDAAGIYLTRTADGATATQAKAFDLRLDSPLARHSLPTIIMDGRTAAAVIADIDAAIKLGSSFCLLGHGIKTAGDSLHMATAEFLQLVPAVKARVNQGLMDVVTMTELASQMRNARAGVSRNVPI